MDVAPAALTATNNISFSSGKILDFRFSFEEVFASISDNSNPTTEGFRTDATGEVIAFVDTSTIGTFADFSTAFDSTTGLGKGVFFGGSGFEFNARSDLTGGNLVTGGMYSITRRDIPVPAPATLGLFGLGLAGLGWSRRKKQRS